ncbi:FadR/GntR family transcriptional regulator [Paenibacillus hexagrammi]|uniref:FadR family transcriptional regulator n=1 Tax=Paenibacillus hexagrammi TaxID=2908839 RepID=A0ABY3SSK7_9BACL|nr:FadR/GntR family transcriptional regulator [Paenibacillus sp. YPD9-1]UJF36001.1 FadR family transcriptional regulator [Paenibacillus sp. YPD9-1]
MEVTKLTKRNHYEEITQQLKQLIVQGRLQAGDKLPSTKELSERFGVGRSTMREALSALRAMGLIDIRQGGGCTVVSSAPTEIEVPKLQVLRLNRTILLELMEARKALEISNAALAAEKRTDEDLETLSRLVREMELAIGNEEEGERTDLLFHLTLVKSTHNSLMVNMLDSIMSPMEMAIKETRRVELYANSSVARRLYQEHLAIYDAVRRSHRAEASHHMKAHLEHVEQILFKYL